MVKKSKKPSKIIYDSSSSSYYCLQTRPKYKRKKKKIKRPAPSSGLHGCQHEKGYAKFMLNSSTPNKNCNSKTNPDMYELLVPPLDLSSNPGKKESDSEYSLAQCSSLNAGLLDEDEMEIVIEGKKKRVRKLKQKFVDGHYRPKPMEKHVLKGLKVPLDKRCILQASDTALDSVKKEVQKKEIKKKMKFPRIHFRTKSVQSLATKPLSKEEKNINDKATNTSVVDITKNATDLLDKQSTSKVSNASEVTKKPEKKYSYCSYSGVAKRNKKTFLRDKFATIQKSHVVTSIGKTVEIDDLVVLIGQLKKPDGSTKKTVILGTVQECKPKPEVKPPEKEPEPEKKTNELQAETHACPDMQIEQDKVASVESFGASSESSEAFKKRTLRKRFRLLLYYLRKVMKKKEKCCREKPNIYPGKVTIGRTQRCNMGRRLNESLSATTDECDSDVMDSSKEDFISRMDRKIEIAKDEIDDMNEELKKKWIKERPFLRGWGKDKHRNVKISRKRSLHDVSNLADARFAEEKNEYLKLHMIEFDRMGEKVKRTFSDGTLSSDYGVFVCPKREVTRAPLYSSTSCRKLRGDCKEVYPPRAGRHEAGDMGKPAVSGQMTIRRRESSNLAFGNYEEIKDDVEKETKIFPNGDCSETSEHRSKNLHKHQFNLLTNKRPLVRQDVEVGSNHSFMEETLLSCTTSQLYMSKTKNTKKFPFPSSGHVVGYSTINSSIYQFEDYDKINQLSSTIRVETYEVVRDDVLYRDVRTKRDQKGFMRCLPEDRISLSASNHNISVVSSNYKQMVIQKHLDLFMRDDYDQVGSSAIYDNFIRCNDTIPRVSAGVGSDVSSDARSSGDNCLYFGHPFEAEDNDVIENPYLPENNDASDSISRSSVVMETCKCGAAGTSSLCRVHEVSSCYNSAPIPLSGTNYDDIQDDVIVTQESSTNLTRRRSLTNYLDGNQRRRSRYVKFATSTPNLTIDPTGASPDPVKISVPAKQSKLKFNKISPKKQPRDNVIIKYRDPRFGHKWEESNKDDHVKTAGSSVSSMGWRLKKVLHHTVIYSKDAIASQKKKHKKGLHVVIKSSSEIVGRVVHDNHMKDASHLFNYHIDMRKSGLNDKKKSRWDRLFGQNTSKEEDCRFQQQLKETCTPRRCDCERNIDLECISSCSTNLSNVTDWWARPDDDPVLCRHPTTTFPDVDPPSDYSEFTEMVRTSCVPKKKSVEESDVTKLLYLRGDGIVMNSNRNTLIPNPDRPEANIDQRRLCLHRTRKEPPSACEPIDQERVTYEKVVRLFHGGRSFREYIPTSNFHDNVNKLCGHCDRRLRFNPYFPTQHRDNVIVPKAKRIVDFAMMQAFEIVEKMRAPELEQEIDETACQTTLRAMQNGISQMLIEEQVKVSRLEVGSELLYNQLLKELIWETIEAETASGIVDRAFGCAHRQIIINNYIRERLDRNKNASCNKSPKTPSCLKTGKGPCCVKNRVRGLNQYLNGHKNDHKISKSCEFLQTALCISQYIENLIQLHKDHIEVVDVDGDCEMSVDDMIKKLDNEVIGSTDDSQNSYVCVEQKKDGGGMMDRFKNFFTKNKSKELKAKSREKLNTKSSNLLGKKSNKNLEARSIENVRTRSNESLGRRSNESLASRSNESLASRSNENLQTRSDENLRERSKKKDDNRGADLKSVLKKESLTKLSGKVSFQFSGKDKKDSKKKSSKKKKSQIKITNFFGKKRRDKPGPSSKYSVHDFDDYFPDEINIEDLDEVLQKTLVNVKSDIKDSDSLTPAKLTESDKSLKCLLKELYINANSIIEESFSDPLSCPVSDEDFFDTSSEQDNFNEKLTSAKLSKSDQGIKVFKSNEDEDFTELSCQQQMLPRSLSLAKIRLTDSEKQDDGPCKPSAGSNNQSNETLASYVFGNLPTTLLQMFGGNMTSQNVYPEKKKQNTESPQSSSKEHDTDETDYYSDVGVFPISSVNKQSKTAHKIVSSIKENLNQNQKNHFQSSCEDSIEEENMLEYKQLVDLKESLPKDSLPDYNSDLKETHKTPKLSGQTLVEDSEDLLQYKNKTEQDTNLLKMNNDENQMQDVVDDLRNQQTEESTTSIKSSNKADVNIKEEISCIVEDLQDTVISFMNLVQHPFQQVSDDLKKSQTSPKSRKLFQSHSDSNAKDFCVFVDDVNMMSQSPLKHSPEMSTSSSSAAEVTTVMPPSARNVKTFKLFQTYPHKTQLSDLVQFQPITPRSKFLLKSLESNLPLICRILSESQIPYKNNFKQISKDSRSRNFGLSSWAISSLWHNVKNTKMFTQSKLKNLSRKAQQSVVDWLKGKIRSSSNKDQQQIVPRCSCRGVEIKYSFNSEEIEKGIHQDFLWSKEQNKSRFDRFVEKNDEDSISAVKDNSKMISKYDDVIVDQTLSEDVDETGGQEYVAKDLSKSDDLQAIFSSDSNLMKSDTNQNATFDDVISSGKLLGHQTELKRAIKIEEDTKRRNAMMKIDWSKNEAEWNSKIEEVTSNKLANQKLQIFRNEEKGYQRVPVPILTTFFESLDSEEDFESFDEKSSSETSSDVSRSQNDHSSTKDTDLEDQSPICIQKQEASHKSIAMKATSDVTGAIIKPPIPAPRQLKRHNLPDDVITHHHSDVKLNTKHSMTSVHMTSSCTSVKTTTTKRVWVEHSKIKTASTCSRLSSSQEVTSCSSDVTIKDYYVSTIKDRSTFHHIDVRRREQENRDEDSNLAVVGFLQGFTTSKGTLLQSGKRNPQKKESKKKPGVESFEKQNSYKISPIRRRRRISNETFFNYTNKNCCNNESFYEERLKEPSSLLVADNEKDERCLATVRKKLNLSKRFFRNCSISVFLFVVFLLFFKNLKF